MQKAEREKQTSPGQQGRGGVPQICRLPDQESLGGVWNTAETVGYTGPSAEVCGFQRYRIGKVCCGVDCSSDLAVMVACAHVTPRKWRQQVEVLAPRSSWQQRHHHPRPVRCTHLPTRAHPTYPSSSLRSREYAKTYQIPVNDKTSHQERAGCCANS